MIQDKKMELSLGKKAISIITNNIFTKNVDFYCLNCLQSLEIKNKIQLHKKVCDLSSTTKVGENILYGYSLLTIWGFDGT